MPAKNEEHGSSNSSASSDLDKFKKISSSVVGTEEQYKDEELEIQGGNSLKRKKRLDAHSYLSSLKPVAKKTNYSDAGRICRKVSDGEDERSVACSRLREDFETPEVAESTSGVKSVGETRACKRAKIAADHDSYTSVTEKAFMTVATSFPSDSTNRSFEERPACSKPQSSNGGTLSRNARTRNDLCPSTSKMGNIDIAEEHHNHSVCAICKRPGLLLLCSGKHCKRSYHLSCLDTPLSDMPPGVWHCLDCAKKKIESGVYSVSEGIECILDSKEGEQNEKHYLVKYKGLAHVHDRWISESVVLVEAPTLLADFNRPHQEKQDRRWKKEWNEPHRLLLKRFLISSGHTEWLVKWKGLGYEDCTWEPENSTFFCSIEGFCLLRDYERFREEARERSHPSSTDKALSVKNDPFHKLSRLPDSCSPGLSSDYLDSTNTLREFWHRSQSAIFVDDQERVVKSILFILSSMSHTCRPFLVITTTEFLSLWKVEFTRLAPSINLVVYNGNKDTRKIIQTLEFYESGCTILQVLLAEHQEEIVEELESFVWILWEAIIIDECQRSEVSAHLPRLKKFPSDFGLLMWNGSIKDDIAVYLNLLYFLDPNLTVESNENTGILPILKERLSRYTAHERKSGSFVEYWIPVQLSTMQLEQYGGILKEKSRYLCSRSKRDHVGALRDILISTRKCCDHPYLVDETLRSKFVNGHMGSKKLDYEVNASSKLRLLDLILQYIKNLGLRVLILFQSSDEARRISIGDILDDFLRERFGANSYERMYKGMNRSQKEDSLKEFNNKASGRFVFLIESSLCIPSIKLSSLDAVIIFNSDLNPLNDLKALQKMSIDSKHKKVILFRLYSSHTVEEKVLIFSKQQTIMESNVHNISSNICHSLLGWGASYIFRKFNEIGQHDMSNHLEAPIDRSLINGLFELLLQLPNAGVTDTCDQSTIVKATQSGVSYSRNIVLDGEKESLPSFDDDPSTFWSMLLKRNLHHGGEENDELKEKRPEVPRHGDESLNFIKPSFSINKSSVPIKDVEGPMHEVGSNSTLFDRDEPEEGEIREDQRSVFMPDEPKEHLMNESNSGIVSSYHQNREDGEIPNTRNSSKLPVLVDQEEALNKQICFIDQICSRRLEELLLKQQLETRRSKDLEDNQRKCLRKKHDLDLDRINASHVDPKVRKDEAELLRNEFAKEMCKFDQYMRSQRKMRRIMQIEERNKEKQIKNLWEEEAKAGILAESFDKIPLSDSGFRVENFYFKRKSMASTDREKTTISLPSNDKNCTASGPGSPAKSAKICRRGTPIVASIGLEDMQRETGTATSVSTSTSVVRSSAKISKPVSFGCEGNMSLQTEIRAQPRITNKVNAFEGMNASSTTSAVDDNVQQGHEDSDGALSSSGSGKSASAFQVLPASEPERPNVSDGLGGDLSVYSSPLPPISGVLLQVGPTSDDLAVSNTILLRPPPSVDLVSVMNGVSCECSPIKTEEEPCNQMHFPTNQIDELGQEERPSVYDELRSDLSGRSSTVPPISGHLPQVGPNSDDLAVSNTILQKPPPSVDLVSIVNGVSCELSPTSTEQEACNQMHFPTNQIDALVQKERPHVSDGLGSDLSVSSSPVSSISGGSSQVRSTSDDLPMSNTILPKPPPSVDLVSITNGVSCEWSPIRSEQEASNLIQFPTNQIDALVQNPGVTIAVHLQQCLSQSVELGSQKGISSSTVPSTDGGSSEARPMNDGMVLANTISLQLPASNVSTSVVRTEKEPDDQMCYNADQTPAMANDFHMTSAYPLPRSVNDPQERTETTGYLPEIFPLWKTLPAQGLHHDPLQNEMMMLHKKKDLFAQMHADKKLKLRRECEIELERVRKMYDTFIRDADAEFLHKEKTLETICSKLSMNQSLAGEFRAKLANIGRSGAAVNFLGPSSTTNSAPRALQTSQPQLPRVPVSDSVSTSSPAATVLPQVLNPSPSPMRLHAPTSASASRSPPPIVLHAPTSASTSPSFQAVNLSTLPRSLPRPQWRPIPPSYAANFVAGNGPRTPAPHLRPSRTSIWTPASEHPAQSGLMSTQHQVALNMSYMSDLMESDPRNFASGSRHTRL